jgi:hypothetical protein
MDTLKISGLVCVLTGPFRISFPWQKLFKLFCHLDFEFFAFCYCLFELGQHNDSSGPLTIFIDLPWQTSHQFR